MSDDLISRQAAIEACLNGWNYDMETIKHIQDNISRLPSVQPKTGRWILDTTQFLPEYVCTNCNSRFPLVASEGKTYGALSCKNMTYCPNCGVKMESEVE